MEEIPDTSATTVANAVAKKAKKLLNLSFSAIRKPIFALFAIGILTEITICVKTPIKTAGVGAPSRFGATV
jgi:hypothetical protein